MIQPPPLDVWDTAALDTFTADLIAAGFERDPTRGRRRWTGPIHPGFTTLTDATEMTVELRDGWPARHPGVVVEGLRSEHVNASGHVCLWRADDISLAWLRWHDISDRIEQWTERARTGWQPQDFALDAWLGFSRTHHAIVTLDLPALRPTLRDGTSGILHVRIKPLHWQLRAGAAREGQLHATWYARTAQLTTPRTLEQVRESLTTAQQRNLDRNLARRADVPPGVRSGGLDLILLTWDRGLGQDAMAISFGGAGDRLTAHSHQLAPIDHESLLRRAGPDATLLHSKTAAIVGCGAIGSHVAVQLATSGIGHLRLSDADTLLPANLVRHAAPGYLVGALKTAAVKAAVQERAPWTDVEVAGSITGPASALTLARGADIVIDTTGQTALSLLLPDLLDEHQIPLISSALYRGGALARIRRQALPADTPISQRPHDARYPTIQPGNDGDDDHAGVELGCTALVHNAPPANVTAAASLTVQEVINILAGRATTDYDEVIDVYRPVQAPLDKRGLALLP